MNETKIGNNTCPTCGYYIDTVSGAFDKNAPKPNPGDLSVCLSCGEFQLFADDMEIIVLPNAIYESLPEEIQDKLQKVRDVIKHSAHYMKLKKQS